ncbi:WbqC family protein [Paralcaligenes ureilyticus]|uniref:WbqC-like protein n=1 Tax=Paralcaligenes ureilyticus TaxID=627131 RepID=A0A4R3M9X9_9BURK|nr:WbqC family protein [Paralcaligenes ureilyticus]TCT09059.1 WbqC-like protein [Paralcaligenes ureilyticus]
MKLAIMQPYFLPYIGYFQLIAAVDLFIVYDNIKYTKKGWINRNRMLRDGKDVVFSLPLKNDSDYLDVCARELAASFDRTKLLKQLEGAYSRAPHFTRTRSLLEEIMLYQDANLFRYLHHSIIKVCEHLGIKTEIKISSDIDIDHSLKGQDKVIALCDAIGASGYINAIGGIELYSKEAFRDRGIDLAFLQTNPINYTQLDNTFVPWLSIIDVIMFNSPEEIGRILTNYKLI